MYCIIHVLVNCDRLHVHLCIVFSLRMYQVPVISPWPPPLVRNRRPRGNRYKERRHGEKERYAYMYMYMFL